MGYGSDALIFGPQFGNLRAVSSWKRTLATMSVAISRGEVCSGRHTLAIFRSPAFNFDPVNSFQEQSVFVSPLPTPSVGLAVTRLGFALAPPASRHCMPSLPSRVHTRRRTGEQNRCLRAAAGAVAGGRRRAPRR